MYLLDWKVSKRYDKIIDTLYSEWLEVLPTDIKNTSKDKALKALSCFVGNVGYSISKGKDILEVSYKKEVYSKPLIYNCNTVKRKVSYTYTMKLFEYLDSLGIISVTKGGISKWSFDNGVTSPLDKSVSTLKLSSYLIDMFVSVDDENTSERLTDVLEVRDSSGNKISKRIGDKERWLIETLNTYNTLANKVKVEANGSRYWIQAKKVFNNSSFNCGGRTYLVGDTSVMKNSIRKDLKLDGKDTVELDYSALHPRIIAEIEGEKLVEGFDPYGIVLGGYDLQCLRKIVKVALLCCINAKDFNSARKALNYHMMKNMDLAQWKKDCLLPPVVGTTDIFDAILYHNTYLSEWLYKGKGGLLQNIDSKMMDYIIDSFQQKGSLIIPIHDGLICQKSFTRWGIGIMIDAYEEVLGSKYNVKIKER